MWVTSVPVGVIMYCWCWCALKASQLYRTVDCLSPLDACMTSVIMKITEIIKLYLKKFSGPELGWLLRGWTVKIYGQLAVVF